MTVIEHRVELLSHPDRLTVRVHEELPRAPECPHFAQTRPVDREYVPVDQLAGAVEERDALREAAQHAVDVAREFSSVQRLPEWAERLRNAIGRQ
jgi:hypothetical protein